MFNDKIEVGRPAMIINTRLPENYWLIGSVVTVEGFIEVGDDISHLFELPDGFTLGATKLKSVLVSGCKRTGQTVNGDFQMKKGYALFNSKNLMPIPKLKESEIQKEKELEAA